MRVRSDAKAELISVVDNVTIHAKLKYHRHQPRFLFKIRGIKGILDKDPNTMQWLRLCFQAYEDKFTINDPVKIASLGRTDIYECNIVLDHQIGLDNLMVAAKHAVRINRYA